MHRVLVMGLSAILLTALTVSLSAQQPTADQDSASSAEISDLQAQIAALEERVAALEGGGETAETPGAIDQTEANETKEDTPADEQQPTENNEAELPLGLDGYCLVTLSENKAWRLGDEQFESAYESRRYRFVSAEALEQFENDPATYAPAAKGYDIVALTRGETIDGERAHGVFYRDSMYLFASEKNLQEFWMNLDRYAIPASNHN